jgi:hypothetical protein
MSFAETIETTNKTSLNSSRVHAEQKSIFGILGLPRSGTTLLNGILNSYANAFSISEPHWSNILAPHATRLDKISFDCSNNKTIYANLDAFLTHSNEYVIGGIKETYREHQPESANFILHSDQVDFVIGVFREPASGFSAWLRTEWRGYYDEPTNYIKSYKKLHQTLTTITTKRVFLTRYERLCEEGITYLNEVFAGHLRFDELHQIKKSDFHFGDPQANQGGDIRPARTDTSNVSKAHAKLIRRELNDIYTSIL